jgi:adenine deaminase
MVEPSKVYFPDHMFHTVRVQDFKFPSIPQKGKIRVMELVSNLVTQERIIDLKDPKESKDILMLLAMDRIGEGGAFLGFLKGFGLRRGAYGTTMCWDTVDMIVVGCDMKSMETVIKRLQETGGGGVCAVGEEVVAEFPAPLGGLLSLKRMETIRDEIKGLEKSLRKNGAKWEKNMLAIDTLSTTAIPHLRITHHGYVRLRDRKELPLEV